MYVSYLSASKMLGVEPIMERRDKMVLSYTKKCVKHPLKSRFFPPNEYMTVNPIIRNREPYTVNVARILHTKKVQSPTANNFSMTTLV